MMSDAGMTGVAGRVLVVDDEPAILAALRRVLQANGFEVFLAASGPVGLEILEREAVDVVLSDMRMPEMDGAVFLETVFKRWPDTKRILLTGYADVAATVAAINRGKIWRYIAKPWSDDDLLLTIQQAVGHRLLMRENARLLALTQAQNDELKSLNASLEARVEARTHELQDALKSLHQGFVNIVKLVSNIIELRGGSIAGHSRRVADHARKVALRLGMRENEVQEIFLAGLLHDIGKLGLSDEVIEQPFNSLGPKARAEVIKHPGKGEMLLMSIGELAGVAQLVRHHHEMFDGSGYPDALVGERIPLGARVLAVVNDFDALQMGTLVSRSLRLPDAVRYLSDNRGKRYDPAVVDAFSLVLAEATSPDELVEVPMRPGLLQPGMRLTRDLMHREGYLLLARDQILTAPQIAQLARFEAAEKSPVVVYVRKIAVNRGGTTGTGSSS